MENDCPVMVACRWKSVRRVVTVVFAAMLSLLLQPLAAQFVSETDTVKLGQVVVKPSGARAETGFRQEIINTAKELVSPSTTLSAVLRSSANLYTRDYGPGGLSTISVRGMGASHTETSWEGLRINSVMAGQSDFSTIPAWFIDYARVSFGGNPGSFGNRGPGGSVAAGTIARWRDTTLASLVLSAGSFGNYSGGAGIRTGNGRLEYELRTVLADNSNLYTYYNPVSALFETRRDAATTTRGVMNKLYLRQRNNIISAALMYTHNYRMLPGAAGTEPPPSNESQLDESLRSAVSLTGFSGNITYKARAGFTNDWLNYKNRLFEIDSRNRSNSYTVSTEATLESDNGTIFSGGIRGEYSSVASNNYSDPASRQLFTGDLGIRRELGDRGELLISWVQALYMKQFIRPSVSLGFDFDMLGDGRFHLSGSAGTSHHLPTLNDLYWVPGGNSSLRPELSASTELTLLYTTGVSDDIRASGSLTVYHSSIREMIAWVPVTATVWSPENISRVLAGGVEYRGAIEYRNGVHSFESVMNMAWNRVFRQNRIVENDRSAGRQLIYVPLISGSLQAQYGYRLLRAGVNLDYSGTRYITSDNSESLPPYLLAGAHLSVRLKTRRIVLTPGIEIKNIASTAYQNIAGYPMPGREIVFTLKTEL